MAIFKDKTTVEFHLCLVLMASKETGEAWTPRQFSPYVKTTAPGIPESLANTASVHILQRIVSRRQELGVCLLTHYAKFPKCSRGSAWPWDARLALFTFCKSCSDRPQDAGKGWGQLIRKPIHIGSEDAVDVDRIFLPLLKEVENKLKGSYFKWKYPYQPWENHENNFLPYYDVICGTYVGQQFKTKGDPHATHQQLAVCHYVSYTVLEMER